MIIATPVSWTVILTSRFQCNLGDGKMTETTPLKGLKKNLASSNPHPPLTSLQPLQQIPPHPGDFEPKFPSAVLDIHEQNQTGGILAGYSAGSTGKGTQRDTRRDPLASSSGGILGGIHWRAALAGFWVGAWCRSIANADSNIKSNNPFMSGGEKLQNFR